MAAPGFIYVLFNPSMPGLVKVGKTERDPEERARELSSTTGVPVPFVVVYQAYFEDSALAERHIHVALDSHRLALEREFFRVSPTVAINAVLSAPGRGANRLPSSTDVDSFNNLEYLIAEVALSPSAISPCDALVLEADKYLHGIEGVFQNERKARELFERAAKVGCAEAYARLGWIYSFGLGVKENSRKSLEYYREAVAHGHVESYPELAFLYSATSEFKHFGSWKLVV